jgi:kinetochore protein Spc24
LSRVLEAAKKSSMRPPNVPSLEKHASHLNDLDGSRLSLAKAIRDAEGSLASKEAELAALRDQARSLEESDPAKDHQNQLDGSA